MLSAFEQHNSRRAAPAACQRSLRLQPPCPAFPGFTLHSLLSRFRALATPLVSQEAFLNRLPCRRTTKNPTAFHKTRSGCR